VPSLLLFGGESFDPYGYHNDVWTLSLGAVRVGGEAAFQDVLQEVLQAAQGTFTNVMRTLVTPL
jgi:hypothetical protein